MSASYEPRLAGIASMIGDPARSRMLAYLLSGDYASAGELARAAGVTPATASAHLVRLLDARLLSCEARGRHRYYRIADHDVAHALEALALVAERQVHERAWEHPGRRPLRFARCCYGHLAGELSIRLFDTLQSLECLAPMSDGFALTERGTHWLADMGLQADPPSPRRRFAYRCLDWSERKDHLAGQLADQILRHGIERGWLRREQGRCIGLTQAGQLELLPRLCKPMRPAA